jgi:hypothetical protein
MDHLTPEHIPQLTRRPAAHRSRVTNGSKLLPLSDGRSATARRFRDLFENVCNDLGGIDRLSEAERQLARRAAMLSAESERLEAMAARGEAGFDIEIYALQTGMLCRVLNLLGVRRVARPVESLDEYLHTKDAAK